ncbi:MAG TPA: tetratricopeptide repeat protein [Gemmatimonadaceae bacterium]|jgi:tetratricopeptide (TPR) repeat protein|nr:tetratricopeptide repeat protein [Gemmatimonadaceae bacterium]
MTTPNVPARKKYGADEEGIAEWVRDHGRELTWTVTALAVIVGGFWFYERSQAIKSQRAETAYLQARQAVEAGNLPLGISDLQKVVNRYEGTAAGSQAAMTLAQALYDSNKFKEGVAALKKVEGSVPSEFKASIHVLEAAGYEGLKDFANAAEQFRQASDATKFPADKAEYLASAARDYQAAGNIKAAIGIWQDLEKNENPGVAGEARVRLGELEAKPMTV